MLEQKKVRENITDKNYILYRRFILNKLKNLIDKNIFQNVRLIMVSDHGYLNSNDNFDEYLTTGYFLGFDEIGLSEINSVQDLGILIYNSFTNKHNILKHY